MKFWEKEKTCSSLYHFLPLSFCSVSLFESDCLRFLFPWIRFFIPFGFRNRNGKQPPPLHVYYPFESLQNLELCRVVTIRIFAAPIHLFRSISEAADSILDSDFYISHGFAGKSSRTWRSVDISCVSLIVLLMAILLMFFFYFKNKTIDFSSSFYQWIYKLQRTHF